MRATNLGRGAGASMVLALLLGVLAATLAAQPAHARIVSVSFTFDELAPGETRSDTAPVSMPRDAVLVSVELAEDSTDSAAFDWSAELCPPAGACLPVTRASEGSAVVAGQHTLAVSVALDVDAPALVTSTLTGRLVFSADDIDDDGLPPTGAVVGPLVALAGGLLLGGAVLLGAARRHREVHDA